MRVPRPKRPGAPSARSGHHGQPHGFRRPRAAPRRRRGDGGQGPRSSEVRDACRATGSVYFVACGGAAAYLAKCVASSETVAYDDLGTEALRRIDVVDFPVFVGVDVRGRDVYDLV